MPVPERIVHAAESFRRNRGVLSRSLPDLTAEEWVKCPGAHGNSILWIAGHIVWARAAVLRLLGAPAWTRPWLAQFARGTAPCGVADGPSPEEMLAAVQETDQALAEGLEHASREALAAPAPPNTPPGDGTAAGVVDFLAWHETYHVGQVAYLRSWLGRKGSQG